MLAQFGRKALFVRSLPSSRLLRASKTNSQALSYSRGANGSFIRAFSIQARLTQTAPRFVTRTLATFKQPLTASYRLFSTSLVLERKGTEAIRRARAAAMPQPPPAMKEGILFEKDKVLTGVAILQGVFFLSASQFYWYYDVSVVNGLYAGSDILSRLAWPTFFAAVGAFLPITRYFFGSRFVQKLELVATGHVNIYTYDFWARPKLTATVPVKSFRAKDFNDSGEYYKFRVPGHKWFFIVDKTGHIGDLNAFTSVLTGKLPERQY